MIYLMEGELFVKKKLFFSHIPNNISIGYYAQKNSVSWEYFIHAHIPGAYWGEVPNRRKHHHVNSRTEQDLCKPYPVKIPLPLSERSDQDTN